MTTIVDVLRAKFPKASPLTDYRILVSDGVFTIEHWNEQVLGEPKPDEATINSWIANFVSPTPEAIVDGLIFLSRVTDDEYAAITAAGRSNASIGRWIDMFRLLGYVDVNGTTAQTAKAGLVSAGLLTQERADVIFAP